MSPAVANRLASNYEHAQSPTFVADMSAFIRQSGARVVRIHVAGDFFDAPYIHKWRRIAMRFPATTFFAYTRSWREKRMRRSLHRLAGLKNCHLWFSADRDTHRLDGRPPRWKGVRVAWMKRHPNEFVPAYTDLVFRVYRGSVEKYINGRLVCPSENGTKPQFKITCTDCKLCYQQRAIPRKQTDNSTLVQLEI